VSDDYDPDVHGYSLDDVCERLDSIEQAIKSNRSDFGWAMVIAIWWFAFLGLSDLWHSKMRYAWSYDVSSDQVTIEKKPKDCNFFRAPMGEKGCHYDRQVNTVRVKTVYLDLNRGSVNYVSFDDGKTWAVDTNPPTKPRVEVSWERIEDQ
jgi:hypothetical protein